jgi:hypothetical protein
MGGIAVPGIGKHRQTRPPKHCGSLKTGFRLRLPNTPHARAQAARPAKRKLAQCPSKTV